MCVYMSVCVYDRLCSGVMECWVEVMCEGVGGTIVEV